MFIRWTRLWRHFLVWAYQDSVDEDGVGPLEVGVKPPERLDGVVESGRAAALLLQPAHDVEVQLGGERALGLHKGN